MKYELKHCTKDQYFAAIASWKAIESCAKPVATYCKGQERILDQNENNRLIAVHDIAKNKFWSIKY